MKFLLTNDDGVDAPGLQVLADVASAFGEVLVVAPDRHLSGCSHQVTTDRPLKLTQKNAAKFALDGTPADCVRVGLDQLASDIDWILSGVNDGGNLGVDVNMSGTVAAVREGTYLGCKGIAISRYRRQREVDNWPHAAALTKRVLQELLDNPPADSAFWNVNLPDTTRPADQVSLTHCPLDPHPLPQKYEQKGEVLYYRGEYRQRRQQPHHDVHVCFGGDVAVTQVLLPVAR